MGPKKTWGGRRAETAGRGRGSRRLGREIRTEADIIGDQQDSDDDSDGEGEGEGVKKGSAVDGEDGEEEDGGEDDDDEEDEGGGGGSMLTAKARAKKNRIPLAMWEFGQNDPKRDSGSKMVRFGFARKLRIGQSFPGIVLSSEATETLSPADAEIIEKYGIAGINCSWNRLTEIPFNMMGRSQNQRKLPLLVAANTVNYGKPFKMNTAEALAGSLYIAGFKEEAMVIMDPFSFGKEFLKLNHELLEAYSACSNQEEVAAAAATFIAQDAREKEERRARKQGRLAGTGIM